MNINRNECRKEKIMNTIAKRVPLGLLIAMNLTMVGQTAESPIDPPKDSFRVGNPRCEYRVNPLGIQTPTPQFGWILESTTVGTCRTAYRIVVASTQADLARQNGDMWDSGKVKSPQSLYIPYHGSVLKPLTKYFWQVGVWNQDDVVQWSTPQTFVMGKLTASKWRGSWIESGQETKSAIYLRKTFPIAKPVANAYLSICGLGGADVSISGQRVSEEMAITSPSNWGRKAPYPVGYSMYEVTRYLRDGDNCIGVVLGNAFCHSESHLKQYDIGQVKMICDLDVTFSDTTTTTVVSDATWTWSFGAIKFYDLRFGQEDVDMRDRMPGWNTTVSNGPAWSSVKLLSPQLPKEILRSRQEPPILVYKTTQLTADKNSTYQFPEFLVGHVRFDASGTSGTIINVGMSKFILSGDGAETYEQRFGFHGMTGTGIGSNTKGITISNLSFVSTATGVDVTGQFSCNDAIIEHIVSAGYNTGRMQTMGALGLETREKCGWGEDGKNTLQVNLYAADMLTIGRKWMWGFLDRQDGDGGLASVVPGNFGGKTGSGKEAHSSLSLGNCTNNMATSAFSKRPIPA